MPILNPRARSGPDTRTFTFSSPGGGSGTYFIAGFYEAPAADANLNQAGPTVNLGSVNSPYGAHAFLVAGGAGAVDAGSCSIVVSGTSVNDQGVRTGGDSETIVADITAMALNQYFETTRKWIGQVVYTLTPAGAAVYNADFNYGLCKYDDIGNRNFTITDFEVVGRAAAADAGIAIALLHHQSIGWTYNAAAFVPGLTPLIQMSTDYAPEDNLVNGDFFAWKRDNLSTFVHGDDSEGFLIRIITTANNAIETMDANIRVRV
jgi:hypothetical protein